MSLRDRLRRLEGGLPAPRCAHCAEWGPTRLVWINDDTGSDHRPQPPERCEHCGYKPISIAIEYVAWPPESVA